MDLHASFSWWTPEIYARIAGAHVYVSVWKALLLVAVIVLLLRQRTTTRSEHQETSASKGLKVAAWIASVLYLSSVLWPVGQGALALPWNSPPPHIHFDGIDYGSRQGGPDPRVDTYGCHSEDSVRDGSFRNGSSESVGDLERVGHLAGLFGGPSLYRAQNTGGSFLFVRASGNCWIPYPQWI